MEKINIAVIGCSAIANKTVIPTIQSNKCFNLKIVGSRTVEKGKQFADKFECEHGTYDDVLNDSAVNAVYVSVPTGLHYPIAKKVLEAGKHLLLEKPFTDTLANATEIIRIASNRGLVAMEALPYVYHPYFNKLKELLGSNIIGNIRLIESSFGFPYLSLDDIRNKAEIGGGAILDNLIYPLSASIGIMPGNINSKSYRIIFDQQLKIDQRGFLRLDWESASANINYGFGFAYKNTIEVWGSEGSITIDRAFTKPADAIAEIVVKKNNTTEIISIPGINQFALMIDAFYNKVVGVDKSGKNEGDNLLKRMAIISEMYLYSKTLAQ